METKVIEVGKIVRLDGKYQPREGVSGEVVEQYRQEMEDGALFPPIVVFWDGTTYRLADGLHRLAASEALGKTLVEAEIRAGGLRDAILYAVGCNVCGHPRTNEEKRRAVRILLADTEWWDWVDSDVAKACAVSAPFVGKMRNEVMSATPNVSSSDVRKYMRNGKVQKMRTGNIGKEKRTASPPQTPTAPGGKKGEGPSRPPASAANEDRPTVSTFDPQELYFTLIEEPELIDEVADVLDIAREYVAKVQYVPIPAETTGGKAKFVPAPARKRAATPQPVRPPELASGAKS